MEEITFETPRKIYSPFDVSDFFSYIIPAFSLIVYLFIFIWITNYGFLKDDLWRPVSNILGLVKGEESLKGIIIVIFASLVSMVLLYLVGYLISSMSVYFIERSFFFEVFGSPVEHLLGLGQEREFSKVNNYSLLTWGSFILLIMAVIFLMVISGFFIYGWKGIDFLISGYIIIILYTTYMRIFTNKKFKRGWIIKKFGKLRTVVENGTNLKGTLNPKLKEKYKNKIKTLYEIDMDKTDFGNEYYWLSYIYVLLNNPEGTAFIKKLEQQYILTRNMTGASWMMSSIMLIYFLIAKQIILSQHLFPLLVLFITVSLLGWLFFTTCIHQNHTIYTKNLLRVFSIMEIKK